MKRRIVAACEWYCDRFGTEWAFALSVLVLALWALLIPVLGWTHWNATAGLFGNTVESTGEWLFAVATLVLARKITARQEADRTRDVELLKEIQECNDRLEQMSELIFEHQLRGER